MFSIGTSHMEFYFLVHIDPKKPDEFSKCKIHCSKMSCQPGFAYTSYSAQGKTLPKMLCPLQEGGFAVYVAASRATSRRGLAIFQPVTLDNLNHKLHSDLVQEERWHEIMEHNTPVKYGFLQTDIFSVPDPEGETAENFLHGKPHYTCNDDDGNPIPKKITKKHSLDYPNPVKNEIYPTTQHIQSTQKKHWMLKL